MSALYPPDDQDPMDEVASFFFDRPTDSQLMEGPLGSLPPMAPSGPSVPIHASDGARSHPMDFPPPPEGPDYSRRDALRAELDAARHEIRWPLASMQRSQERKVEQLSAFLRDADREAQQEYENKLKTWEALRPKTKTGQAIGYRPDGTAFIMMSDGTTKDIGPAQMPAQVAAQGRARVADIAGTSREDVARIGAESREKVAGITGASREKAAVTRAGATTGAAQIRADAPGRIGGGGRPDYAAAKAQLSEIDKDLARTRSGIDIEMRRPPDQRDMDHLSTLQQHEKRLREKRDVVVRGMQGGGVPATTPAKDPLGIR